MPELMAHPKFLSFVPPSNPWQKCINQLHLHTLRNLEMKQVQGDILWESLRYHLVKKWQ